MGFAVGTMTNAAVWQVSSRHLEAAANLTAAQAQQPAASTVCSSVRPSQACQHRLCCTLCYCTSTITSKQYLDGDCDVLPRPQHHGVGWGGQLEPEVPGITADYKLADELGLQVVALLKAVQTVWRSTS